MVDDTQTLAAAMANAVGVLNVMVSPDPERNTFKDELTADEFHLHQYFNDDILDIADEMDEIERSEAEGLQQMIQLYGARPDPPGPRDGLRGDTPEQVYTSGMAGSAWRNFDAVSANNAERLAALEAQLDSVMDGVEADYQRLANVLNDDGNREDYVAAVQTINAHETELAMAIERIQLNQAGPSDWDAVYGHPRQNWGHPFSFNYFDAPPTVRLATETVMQMNSAYVDYRLLEEGVSVRVDNITIGDVVKFGVMLVIGEIVSLGIAKFVRAAGAVVQIVRASRAATVIAARFNALSGPVKRRLGDWFQRRRPNARTRRADDGGDVTGQSPNVASRTCPSTARVAC